MNDAILVKILEAIEHLTRVIFYKLLFERVIFVEKLADRPTRDELKYNVDALAIFAEIGLVIPDNIWMVKSLKHFDLMLDCLNFFLELLWLQ